MKVDASGDLKKKVELLLEVPLAKLLTDTRIIDMFAEVFTINGKKAELCRTCQSDRNFAYRKLQTYLKDGITEL
jgi:hypothetical protein